jgi:hypothetical protein
MTKAFGAFGSTMPASILAYPSMEQVVVGEVIT